MHLGDVVVQPNGDLLGHGVNVAARLMARSDPGSVLVSADVRRTIRGPLAERLVSRGTLQLDKMTERIEAFALAAVVGAAAVAAPSMSREPLLAVLPFDNLSDDREMQFFSDGVSEEIIQRLARGARMKVIGRTSSFQFRGADKTARKVADELKCTHILDGSIRRAGGRVRISAHLVEAALADDPVVGPLRPQPRRHFRRAGRDRRADRGRARPDLHELLDEGDRSVGL